MSTNSEISKAIGVSLACYMEQFDKPRYLYLILLICLLVSIAALPFLLVDVSVNCAGVIRPATESTTIKAIASGMIVNVHVVENMPVKKGQIIFEVQSKEILEHQRYLEGRQRDLQTLTDDVQGLLEHARDKRQSSWTPLSSFYLQAYADYGQKLKASRLKLNKSKKDFARNRKLYESGVISTVDIENIHFEMNKSEDELKNIIESQLMVWQQDLISYNKERSQLQSELNKLYSEKQSMNIVAPIDGSIQRLAGVYPGSYIFANQDLGYISPDTSLIAEIYVLPEDIGFLYNDMNVTVQVMAFNYNQWGMLKGKVVRISEDVSMLERQPCFEVVCRLQRNYLALENGRKGMLKRGMTIQARFVVARRSLWNLLYDQIDDWMNPNLNQFDS